MIDPQAYSAYNVHRGEARTAGYVPVFGAKKAEEAQHFDALVRKAEGSDPAAAPAKAAGKKHSGFLDFILGLIDIINPLQHIPVVSTIYRRITGDEISPIARIAGDALYGGPIGAAVGVADVIAEQATGKDIGENMIAMVSGGEKHRPPAAMLARNELKAADIVWNDPPAISDDLNARLALLARRDKQDTPARTPSTPGAAGKGLADYARTRSVPPPKDGAAAGQGAEAPKAPAAASTPVLQPQDAPADAPARPVPPGLIAREMMSGLDKYAAQKKEQWSPAYSATF
jgi:hypothetical protein